jgi:hypothetical protein
MHERLLVQVQKASVDRQLAWPATWSSFPTSLPSILMISAKLDFVHSNSPAGQPIELLHTQFLDFRFSSRQNIVRKKPRLYWPQTRTANGRRSPRNSFRASQHRAFFFQCAIASAQHFRDLSDKSWAWAWDIKCLLLLLDVSSDRCLTL